MADESTRDITIRSLGITLKDVPYSAPEEEVRAAAQTAVQMKQTVPTAGPIPWEQVAPGGPEEELTGDEKLRQAEEQAAQQPPQTFRERLRTTWGEAQAGAKDILSAVTRGGAPAAVGAAAGGAVAGGPGAMVGATAVPVANLVVQGVNALFGTDWQTPSEAVKGWLQEKGLVDPPEGTVNQTLEMLTEAVAASYGASGLAGTVANAPSAGNVMNAARTPMTMTSGTTGAPIAPTTGRTIAAQMANQPGINAAMEIPSGLAQGGVEQAGRALDLPEEITQPMSFAAGLLVDLGLGGAADQFIARAGARSAPVPESSQQLIDITQRNQPGRPLSTDEAIAINPEVTPTARETRSISRHLQNPKSGVTDTMLGRLDDTRTAIRELSEVRGVEVDPVYQMIERYDEPILRMYNEARGGRLREAWEEQQSALAAVSDPDIPVDVSGTSALIDDIKADFAEQNPERLMGAGQELDRIQQSIEGMPADRLYRELQSLRTRVNDTVDPRYRDELDTAIKKISRSLREEIGGHVEEEAGELARTNFEMRTAELEDLMKDFKDQSLKSIIEEYASMPEARWNTQEVRKILRPGTDRATFEPFFNQLNEEGQDLVERTIYGTMLQAANPLKPSPTAYVDMARQYRDMLNVVHADSPEKMTELDSLVEFLSRVGKPIEEIASSGPTAGRMGFDTPTGGIALSQVSRSLGPAGGLLLGDMLQNSFGALARAHQIPETRDMILSLRHMTPGSEAELETMKRILRQVYIRELRMQEDAAPDTPEREPVDQSVNPRAYRPPATIRSEAERTR